MVQSATKPTIRDSQGRGTRQSMGWKLFSSSSPLYSFLVLQIVIALSTRVVADYTPYHESAAYDNGEYGTWPTETYRSAPLLGPALNYIQRSPLCGTRDEYDTGGELYTLLAPRGSAVRTPGPMVIDRKGHLVWTKDYGQTHGIGVYEFHGKRYLTFGVENDGRQGFGNGVYYMLDSSYREAYKIKGANGYPTDLREFHITRDETALITTYEIITADLRPIGGPQNGKLYDSIVQEIDIESGKAVFQWRASEHVDFTQVPRDTANITEAEDEETAWDFFGVNSVDKDGNGNFLVSSGTTNALVYINGDNGEIIWNLGGQNNSFRDISNGAATKFNAQQNARFQDNDTAITIFDTNNPVEDNLNPKPARGLYLLLDQAEMTVYLRHEYTSPNIPAANSTTSITGIGGGSVQLLAIDSGPGKILQSYGQNQPAWAEFSLTTGTVLCEVYFGSIAAAGEERIYSDRVMKAPWIGRPNTYPDIAVYGYETAVSWNGATEVATWVLQGTKQEDQDAHSYVHSDASGTITGSEDEDGEAYNYAFTYDDSAYTFLAAQPKKGFETTIVIPAHATSPEQTPYLRMLALDASGTVLAASKLVRWDPDAPQAIVGVGGPVEPASWNLRPLWWFTGGFAVASVVALVVWAGRRKLAARRVYARLGRKHKTPSAGTAGEAGNSNRYKGGYGEASGWDSDDADLSDDELIDAVEFSLLGGNDLRKRGIKGFDDSDSDSDIEVGPIRGQR